MRRTYSYKKSIKNSKNKSRRKIYRKKRGSFKLKGGTYLKNNLRQKYDVKHPLQFFVENKLDDHYIIHLNPNNINQLNYDDIYTRAFFEKYVDILNYSFEKEREYAISQGSYSPGFKHSLESIKKNIHHPKFHTYILTSSNLTPISFLYIQRENQEAKTENNNHTKTKKLLERELHDGDYDKVWTVCTDPSYRGQGVSSKLMNHITVEQLNNNRQHMLLEVFNDHVISRDDNDVKQEQIMNHFQKNGFVHIPIEELSDQAQANVIHPTGNTKIMVFKPDKWYQNNDGQGRNLNHRAKGLCKS